MKEEKKLSELESHEVISNIREIVDWYYTNAGKVMSPGAVLKFREILTAYYFYLSELVADYKRDYNYSYFVWKIGISRVKINMIKAGSKIGKAEDESMIDENNVKMFKQQLDDEALAVKIESLHRAVAKIIDALASRQRVLETEGRMSKNQV